jgi:hypothetical protein
MRQVAFGLPALLGNLAGVRVLRVNDRNRHRDGHYRDELQVSAHGD